MHSTFNNRISTAETSVDAKLKIDHTKYKVSVMDMVNSSRKNATEEFSMPNFPAKMNPNFDANLDKPQTAFMSKDPKPRDYLTQYRAIHKLDPGPIYKVEMDMAKNSPAYPNCIKH